jgi:hypothetical protein
VDLFKLDLKTYLQKQGHEELFSTLPDFVDYFGNFFTNSNLPEEYLKSFSDFL